jgi:hypothetical protein
MLREYNIKGLTLQLEVKTIRYGYYRPWIFSVSVYRGVALFAEFNPTTIFPMSPNRKRIRTLSSYGEEL